MKPAQTHTKVYAGCKDCFLWLHVDVSKIDKGQITTMKGLSNWILINTTDTEFLNFTSSQVWYQSFSRDQTFYFKGKKFLARQRHKEITQALAFG